MKYRFNRKELYWLLRHSKQLYNQGILQKEKYNILHMQLCTLLYGDLYESFKKTPNIKVQLERISNLLSYYNDILDDKTLDILINMTNSILAIPVLCPKDIEKLEITESELIEQALQIYEQYDRHNYEYLKRRIDSEASFLEIRKKSLLANKQYMSFAMHLVYYNNPYVRLVKTNSILDVGHFVHEFRHVLDMEDCFRISSNLLSEVNPIFMELYCNKQYKENNPIFETAIAERLNDTYKVASNISSFLCLLHQNRYSKHLTTDMIYECFDCQTKQEVKDVIIDLSSYIFSANFDYMVGTIFAVHLCDMATVNINDVKKIVQYIKENLSKPIELDNIFSIDFGLPFSDMNVYKKFIMEEAKTYVKRKDEFV